MEKSCPGGAEVMEEAAKYNVPAGEDGTDDTGTPFMAEGVVIWREEVLAFFIKVVSSSISLRLLPGLSIPGGDIVAIFAA